MAGARGRPKAELTLSAVERETLQRWSRRPKSSQALALRSRIVLACASGATNTAVADRLGVNRVTVDKWRARFVRRRLEGLSDEPRSGAPRKITDEQVEGVIVKTLESTPDNATHWSTRSMAAATGLNQTAVSRIWRAFGLKPHQQETFKLSTDPQFVEKVRDVVGLYMDPPERALVLCVDEKTQVQALDRSQPVFPMMPGVPERATHDYIRAGTLDLFAALEVAGPTAGRVITQIHARHRAIEFRRFLLAIDKAVPADLDVHLICDNLSTHKAPAVKKWLLAHSRFHLHFTPTGSSWLNLVERWFAEITTKLIRRGVHRSVKDLSHDITTWAQQWNDNPKPYVWTKTADDILDSIAAYCSRINDSRH
jgi:transposase